MMTTGTDLKTIYKPIEKPLTSVRENLAHLQSDFLKLLSPSAQIEKPYSSGKLLRPALCLFSAGLSGAKDIDEFVDMATALEAFHLGAIAHDDVIDGAIIRRGMSSLNARWSDHAAVLVGDYLIARGLDFLRRYECPKVLDTVVKCLRQMAEGELNDLANGKNRTTLEQCLDLARAKTASLFGTACCAPAYYLNIPHAENLEQFGVNLGTAFQLIDDLLDLTEPQETLGKAACNDLVCRKKTLPILFLKESLGTDGQKRLEAISGKPLSKEDQEWVAEVVEQTGVRQKTENVARDFLNLALSNLEGLPVNEFSDGMHELAEFVINRAF